MQKQTGFTLIEVLVVVIIIAVLAAVAVPQYQRAVLKSRFSSLMPTTKAVRDGNEAYYLAHGRYATATNQLDVTATNNEDMTLELSRDPDYSYVLATHPDLSEKNNLIMYQKQSAQFPGEIHCEAKAEDTQAQWLCERGMHATRSLGEVITEGFNTYVIEGTGNGLTPAEIAAMNGPNCDKAIAMGYTCSMTENEDGTITKRTCNAHGMCSIYNYNEDGSYKRNTCQLNGDNICENKTEYIYDASGKLVSEHKGCSSMDNATGECTAYSTNTYYTYDENGNVISSRTCNSSRDSVTGTCASYSFYPNIDYVYDANGNKIAEINCSSVDSTGKCTDWRERFDYTYDANGNMLSQRGCHDFTSNGECRSYFLGQDKDYTYDSNGNIIYEGHCQAGNPSSCSNYSRWEYAYDANGNMISIRTCRTVNTNTGECTAYARSDVTLDHTDYTYDANGNKISERYCGNLDSNHNCVSYSSLGRDYTYDGNGNVTAELTCDNVGKDGKCTSYSQGIFYTYDSNGNKTSERRCDSVDSSGSCSSYSWEGYYVAYDENGNALWEGLCDEFGEDGDCSQLAGKGGYQ